MDVFVDVSCRYGAPMGRHDSGQVPTIPAFWTVRAARLDSGGYDRGGAYWGHSRDGDVFGCYCAETGAVRYVRALHRASACAMIVAEHREAKFYADPRPAAVRRLANTIIAARKINSHLSGYNLDIFSDRAFQLATGIAR